MDLFNKTLLNKILFKITLLNNIMDKIDDKIIQALHTDGRMTVKALSQHINLSQPSVAERIKRLSELGAIRFTVDIDPKVLGYSIIAIVRINPLPGNLRKVEELIFGISEVTQCDKVTGEDAYICRLHLTSIGELDHILSNVAEYATTNTSIIKSSPVNNRALKAVI